MAYSLETREDRAAMGIQQGEVDRRTKWVHCTRDQAKMAFVWRRHMCLQVVGQQARVHAA